MNNKTTLINDIMLDMNDLTQTQQKKLYSTLMIRLQPYTLETEKYEVATYDNSAHELLKKFIAIKSIKGCSRSTLMSYKLRIEQFIDWLDKPLDKVQTDDVYIYLALYKTERGVTNTTLCNIKHALSSFFIWLYKDEYMPSNPVARVEDIKQDTHKEEPFSKADIEAMRNTCNNIRDRALIEFMLATGCRVAEVCSIKLSDVDFSEKQVSVVGKGNKKRTVFIDDVAMCYLNTYLNSRKYASEMLFCSKKSADALETIAVKAVIRRLGIKAGVEHAHPHRFRRTFCNNLINRGMPIESVKELMGHANISTTMRYYNTNASKVKYEYAKVSA